MFAGNLNCEKQGEGESSCVARKNAFEVMMMSQKSLARKSELPVRIEDRMFNDLVDLFEEKRWKWSDGGDTHGSNFISLVAPHAQCSITLLPTDVATP